MIIEILGVSHQNIIKGKQQIGLTSAFLRGIRRAVGKEREGRLVLGACSFCGAGRVQERIGKEGRRREMGLVLDRNIRFKACRTEDMAEQINNGLRLFFTPIFSSDYQPILQTTSLHLFPHIFFNFPTSFQFQFPSTPSIPLNHPTFPKYPNRPKQVLLGPRPMIYLINCNQIHPMKIILSVLCLLLLQQLASADEKYIKVADYANPNNNERLVLSDDDQMLILYQDGGNFYTHRSYDLKFLYAGNFQAKPVSLETLTNTAKSNALIFATQDGNIFLRNFTTDQQAAQIRLSHIDDCNILKVSPSPDATAYAVLCQGKTQILIGDMLAGEAALTAIDVKFTIQAMSWHPLENKLALAGVNIANENTYNLIVLDVNKPDAPEDYSDAHKLVEPTFVDVEFSQDGLQLAMIIAQSSYVTILQLQTKEISQQAASEATQLLDLQRSGAMLTAYDGQNTYVWVFDGSNYGKYSSKLKTAGLSKTGGYLFTLNPLDNHIIMSKVCKSNEVFIFVAEDNVCTPCEAPCASCFVVTTQCSACVDTFFLNEAAFTCTPCLANCKTCINADTCNKCVDSYYVEDNTCKLCADKYNGCISCIAEGCNICSDADNWVLNDRTCQCKNKFVEVDKKCVACPAHCSVCTDGQTCTTCDAGQHRDPVPVGGKCLCSQGFFQDGDNCKACSLGCIKCDDADTCATCDATNHWSLDEKKQACVCSSGFIQVTAQCVSCSSLIEGCSICKTASVCTSCTDGYDLSGDICNKKPADDGMSTIVIIIIGVGVLLGLSIGGYFIVKMIRKQRGKKVQTLLESQAENQQDQMH